MVAGVLAIIAGCGLGKLAESPAPAGPTTAASGGGGAVQNASAIGTGGSIVSSGFASVSSSGSLAASAGGGGPSSKQALGSSCANAADCQSGFCADGFCCNTACSSACEACNAPNDLGHCLPSPDGSDPDKKCAAGQACVGGSCATWAPNVCGVNQSGTGPDLLLDTGHAGSTGVARDGDRIVTTDGARWLLWDAATAQEVARGTAGNYYWVPPSLRGGVFLIQGPVSLELRNAGTGALIGTIPTATHSAELSSDGSYAWTATKTELVAWSTAGKKLCAISGDYSSASIWAAPSELRIGSGPAAQQRVEIVALPGCTSSLTNPHSGNFGRWFGDGEHFLTGFDSALRVYTKDAVLAATPSGYWVGGTGNYYYLVVNGELNVYQFGSPTPSVASGFDGGAYVTKRNVLFASTKSALYWIEFGPNGYWVHKKPFINSSDLFSFDADAQGRWVAGGWIGYGKGQVVFQGTVADSQASGTLGCGAVTGLAGSAGGHLSVATQMGAIKRFAVINNAWSLDSIGAAWPDTTDFVAPDDWYDLAPPLSKASPSKKCVAVSDQPPDLALVKCASTVVYQGNIPINGIDGYAVGWLSDNRLLVQTYVPMNQACLLKESILYDSMVNVVAKPALLPSLKTLVATSDAALYSHVTGNVYDATTGKVLAIAGRAGAPAANWIAYPAHPPNEPPQPMVRATKWAP